MMSSIEYHNLKIAIDELYKTLSIYPVPKYFGCQSKDKVAQENCLRLITRDMIADFNFSYLGRFDYLEEIPVKQYKGLLPRILELIADQGYVLDFVPRFKLQGIFKEQKHLRTNEWSVLNNYLEKLWLYILSISPAEIETVFPDDFLQDISSRSDDIQQYLDLWENQFYQETAVIHLARLMLTGVEPSYAERDSKNAAVMKAWLIKPKMQKVLEKAFWANVEDEELSALFSDAIEIYLIWVSNYQS